MSRPEKSFENLTVELSRFSHVNPAAHNGRPLLQACVLSVAFPFVPLNDGAIGGAEQVVSALDAAIVQSGGKSIVAACEGSRVSGKLVAIPKIAGPMSRAKQIHVWQQCRQKIEETVRHHSVDLIHLHGIDFFEYLPECAIPKLVTLHLPPGWYPEQIFQLPGERNVFLHCVSQTQWRNCPPSKNLLPPIANGVFVPAEPPRDAKEDFVFALGRICPEKGFHLALDAAKQAGMKMVLAGAVFEYETHQHYFETEIAPRLDADRRFIGPVGSKEKRELMSRARCVLVPSLVPETSSLVTMESLACGTPVVAFRNGALNEIIDNGCTGFLVEDTAQMAEAIHRAAALSSGQCWQSARHRFNLQRMASQYLDRYRSIIGGHRDAVSNNVCA